MDNSSCCNEKKQFDWFLWSSLTVVFVSYLLFFCFGTKIGNIPFISTFLQSIFEIVNKMWWGLLLGLFFVGILAKIPKEFISYLLGKGNSFSGIVRSAASGVLLDLCSHGILVVGMQLYKKGATIGQTMAFLIASPWNSLSLTFILFSLIGLQWTIIIIVLSMAIAIISGLIFDRLVQAKILPSNTNQLEIPLDFHFWKEVKKQFPKIHFSLSNIQEFIKTAFAES